MGVNMVLFQLLYAHVIKIMVEVDVNGSMMKRQSVHKVCVVSSRSRVR